MASKTIYIEKNLGLQNWAFPGSVQTIGFEHPEEISGEFSAAITSPSMFHKVKKTGISPGKIIIDCVNENLSHEDLRNICFEQPLFVVLKEEERDLEQIFETQGIPLLNTERTDFYGMIYASEKMEKVISLIKKVAKTDATVLIRGESGTGKELVAKAIHQLSGRKEQPFVAVNCASIPDTLLEAELFGHKKGAFTDAYTDRKGKFELADKGTLFLDEIGDMPLSLQAKILRALQEREITPLGSTKSLKIDVRVLSATAQNLEEMIKKGQFREDLFYRLNVIPINIPPLRERKEDIKILADYFLEKFATKHSLRKPQIDKKAEQFLSNLEWRGNVRELENLMEKVIIFHRDKEILTEKDLKTAIEGF